MVKKIKFNGGMYPAELKEKWEQQAINDGHTGVWPWLRWLAQKRVNEFSRPEKNNND